MTPISDAYQREHVRNHATDAKDLQYNMGLECGMECARKLEKRLKRAREQGNALAAVGDDLLAIYIESRDKLTSAQTENKALKARIDELDARVRELETGRRV